MPFKSQAQRRFLEGVAHGMKPRDSDITESAAKKFVSHSEGQDTSHLPEHAEKKAYELGIQLALKQAGITKE